MPQNPKLDPIPRRDFVRLAVTSAGAITAGGALLTACEREGALMDPAGWPDLARRGTVVRYPLYVPPTVSPAALSLTEAPAVADLGGGRLSNVLAYNGSFPGPTIVAQRGAAATITLHNGLAQQETITHWHGMIVDDRNDGHPRFAIPPGGAYDYAFTVDQRACLNWYHPHPHMLTGEQVNLGLAGAFVIRDAEEAALGLPSGDHEVPLIVRDATLDRGGNLEYQPRNGGFDGKLPLVNGTRDPYLAVDAGVYRFRILNGANARIFDLAFANGASFTVIGNDGGFLEAPLTLTQVTMAPAERLDVLVSFAGLAVGQSVMLRDLRSGWDLIEFRVTAPATGPTVVPTLVLPAIAALPAPATTRNFSFDGMSKINGLVYDMDRIDFQVPLGQTERWVFATKGNAPHPVHVHGASFQVQTRSGGRNTVFPWEQGWKDTVLLEDGETVEVLIRFEQYRGIYLIHCHKLEHEDMGMMANFEVV